PERFAQQRLARSADEAPAARLRDALVKTGGADQPEVRFVAFVLSENIVRGTLAIYAFEADSFDSGGFATIPRARSAERTDLALKRLYVNDEEAIGRLRRAIQEQRRIQH